MTAHGHDEHPSDSVRSRHRKYSTVDLEKSTRGLLHLNMTLLEQMEKTPGLAALRALQALQRRGPILVTELGDELDMLPSTASRLSDRLADAGLITRRVSPRNRRATVLELTDAGLAVLDDLIVLRSRALTEVADHMSSEELEALIRGAQAFTDAAKALRGPR